MYYIKIYLLKIIIKNWILNKKTFFNNEWTKMIVKNKLINLYLTFL